MFSAGARRADHRGRGPRGRGERGHGLRRDHRCGPGRAQWRETARLL